MSDTSSTQPSAQRVLALYATMWRIRAFEEAAERASNEGLIKVVQHTQPRLQNACRRGSVREASREHDRGEESDEVRAKRKRKSASHLGCVLELLKVALHIASWARAHVRGGVAHCTQLTRYPPFPSPPAPRGGGAWRCMQIFFAPKMHCCHKKERANQSQTKATGFRDTSKRRERERRSETLCLAAARAGASRQNAYAPGPSALVPARIWTSESVVQRRENREHWRARNAPIWSTRCASTPMTTSRTPRKPRPSSRRTLPPIMVPLP